MVDDKAHLQGPLASSFFSLWHPTCCHMISPPGCLVGLSNTCRKPKSLSFPLNVTYSPPSCWFNTCPSPRHLPWKLQSLPGTLLLPPVTLLRDNPGFSFLKCQSKLFLPVVTGTALIQAFVISCLATLICNSLIHSTRPRWTSAMGQALCLV